MGEVNGLIEAGKCDSRWQSKGQLRFMRDNTVLTLDFLNTAFLLSKKTSKPEYFNRETRHLNSATNRSTDKKCPFVGQVSIRGRILTGRVVSTKMHRTIVIRREYLHYVPKYNRYEKRHKNLAAHVSPAFRVEEGDWVTVGQCRPLSKTVSGPDSILVWRICSGGQVLAYSNMAAPPHAQHRLNLMQPYSTQC